MDVTVTHHVDASEPDAQGAYEYYYEYDLYRFGDGGNALIARSYTGTGDEAHFLSIELRGVARLLRAADLKTPLFADAAAHLRAAGKLKLSWLSGRGNGYEPVP